MNEWVRGKVVAKRRWKDGLYSMQVDAPIADFTAGQFVKVALDIGGDRVGRPYSLVNPPQERPLEIYFNEIPEGPLTPRLSELEPGDPVWLSAAASGLFTLEGVAPGRELWLLATGTALGVYLSILRTPDPWRAFERVILVHGVRAADDLTYGETIQLLADAHGERFTFVPLVSREVHGEALAGRVTDLLVSGELERRVGVPIAPERSHVMLCGNSAMIKDARAILEGRGLVRRRGQTPGHYTTEHYH
ncbi:ferredoxin--NADP reductase [Thiococcus pfennigii]|uniref:ferredoxin--NADP reductase n=1 Tax=Thiococcus pfennigii TaxID=1057 RepID=UPI0019056DD8|nr:ferredoxin--NADP reductase [Thiococcus pfennigii]MBK1701057.1 ferredoxin--NADP(+) reductase [Thiococcus pfennigii]MBK1732940.1 ferredoxin--NADP(+) reductase [Thiococcus pfennigii]